MASPKEHRAPMNTIEKIAWMQARACSLHIDFNDNRTCYRTVAQEVECLELDAEDFGTPEVVAECIARNQLVKVRCYPSTPVGVVHAYHHDLAAAVDAVFEAVEPELRGTERSPS